MYARQSATGRSIDCAGYQEMNPTNSQSWPSACPDSNLHWLAVLKIGWPALVAQSLTMLLSWWDDMQLVSDSECHRSGN